MLDRCDFRDERSCSCLPNECRVQMVYVKPVPKPHDTRGWQYGLVGLFAALCLWWGITEGYPEHRKMELATQESR